MNSRCINCGLKTTRLLFLDDNKYITSIVNRWIAPRTVERYHHLCRECWNLASKVTDPLELAPKVGHRHVCVSCGKSILKIRAHLLNKNTEREANIYKVIQQWASPFQVKATSKICHACWCKADKLILDGESGPFNLKTKVDLKDLTPASKHIDVSLSTQTQSLKTSDMNLDNFVSQLTEDTKNTDNIEYIDLPHLDDVEQEIQTVKTEVHTNHIIEDLELDVTMDNSDGLQLDHKIDGNFEHINLPHIEQIEQETPIIKTEVETNKVEDLELNNEVSQLNGEVSQLNDEVSQSKQEKNSLEFPQKMFNMCCVNCGRSVRRIRYHKLKTSNVRETRIFNVICDWAQIEEVTTPLRICHPCWVRADRESSRRSVLDNYEENSKPNVIILPNYRRAGFTRARCFIRHCKGNQQYRIPKSLRRMLFTKYNFYVSPNNRICNYHLTFTNWDFISATIDHSTNEFTASHVEDFVELLENDHLVDFNDISKMQDHLVHYLFGISKEEFFDLLAKVPVLNETPKGEVALAVYLLKLRTGDSNTKLSILTRMSRRKLEILLKNARDAVPLELVPARLRRKITQSPAKKSDGKGKVQTTPSLSNASLSSTICGTEITNTVQNESGVSTDFPYMPIWGTGLEAEPY